MPIAFRPRAKAFFDELAVSLRGARNRRVSGHLYARFCGTIRRRSGSRTAGPQLKEPFIWDSASVRRNSWSGYHLGIGLSRNSKALYDAPNERSQSH